MAINCAISLVNLLFVSQIRFRDQSPGWLNLFSRLPCDRPPLRDNAVIFYTFVTINYVAESRAARADTRTQTLIAACIRI